MLRREPAVQQRFEKDAAQEEFLVGLNRILEPHERQWDLPATEPFPTIHIIGPPRSGTTFLNQLMCHHLDVGYVNHLIAAFWRAPVQGILLSRKLLASRHESDYQSQFGRTMSIGEPHEFGYFWSSHLRYADMSQQSEDHARMIDWNRLCDVLDRMTCAYNRPLVFKPFLLMWHLRDFQRVQPNSLFIRIHRNLVDTAVSLLNARREFLRDQQQWLSLRPLACRGLETQPAWHQVAAQVHHLEEWLDQQTSRLRAGSVFHVAYDELCSDPAAVVDRVRAFLAVNGVPVEQIQSVPENCVRRSQGAGESAETRNIGRLLAQWGHATGPMRRRTDAA